MNIRLHACVEHDLDTLVPMVKAYHEFEGIGLRQAEREASVRMLITDKNKGGVWLINNTEELCGYIALCYGYSIEFGGLDAFVDEFYILPEFRGMGIGRQVLGLIKAEAKKDSIRALHLEVAKDNNRAVRLYASEGFTARDKYILMSTEL